MMVEMRIPSRHGDSSKQQLTHFAGKSTFSIIGLMISYITYFVLTSLCVMRYYSGD